MAVVADHFKKVITAFVDSATTATTQNIAGHYSGHYMAATATTVLSQGQVNWNAKIPPEDRHAARVGLGWGLLPEILWLQILAERKPKQKRYTSIMISAMATIQNTNKKFEVNCAGFLDILITFCYFVDVQLAPRNCL